MAKKKERTPAQQLGDFFDEFGVKEKAKQAAADILKEGIRMTREAILNQEALTGDTKLHWGDGEDMGWVTAPSDDPVNPFVLLGVREDAPAEVVRAAYRALVKMVGPDMPDHDPGRFQLIHEGYDWIKERRGWS